MIGPHQGTMPLHRMFWEAGHRVFGLHGVLPNGTCACGDPTCKAVLKHPLASNWQHTPHWSEEQMEVMEMTDQFKTGFGILCRIDDDFDLLVVDVDARNGGLHDYDRLLEKVPEVAGAGLIVNTGSGGGSKHLFFKVRRGLALVTKHPDYKGIDFKSGAHYVVGAGSLHASGNRYEVALGGPEDIEEAPEALIQLLLKPERHRAEMGNRTVDVSHADLVDMLRYVNGHDDYEVWVRVGMALHHASSGTALDVWDRWSRQSTKYVAEEMPRKWHSFGNSTNPVTMGTLIRLAEQGGWKQPVTFKSDVEFDFPDVGPNCAASEEGPQPLVRVMQAGKPYPVDASGPLQRAVEFVQGRTLAPVELAAQSALAVASLAVMGHADVETLIDRSPTGLYFLSIANSGERKSSCDSFFMKVVHEFEREAARRQAKAMQEWGDEHAIWKASHSELIKRARDGDPHAKEELKTLGPAPVPPPSGDLVVTEPTYEGLTRAYYEGRPALGILSDEGGQFLGGHAMNNDNRQKTLTALNNLWGGKPIKRTRGGDGGYTLSGRRLAMHLMVQPGVANVFFADPQTVDTGFLPRFLITQPHSTIGTRLRSKMQKEAFLGMSDFDARLVDILNTDLPMDPRSRDLSPRLLKLSPEARRLLEVYADETELQQGPGQLFRHVTGFASKSAEQAARIAGVLTLWGDLNAKEVDGPTMQNAITLATYYLAEAARLMRGAIADAEFSRAEKLRVWLLENWAEQDIVYSEILQFGPYELRNSKEVGKALNLLLAHRWLIRLPKGTAVRGSARNKAWRIVR